MERSGSSCRVDWARRGRFVCAALTHRTVRPRCQFVQAELLRWKKPSQRKCGELHDPHKHNVGLEHWASSTLASVHLTPRFPETLYQTQPYPTVFVEDRLNPRADPRGQRPTRQPTRIWKGSDGFGRDALDSESTVFLDNPQIVARPAGLEPATPGLEGRCSIQMSYGRVSLRVLCVLCVDSAHGAESPSPGRLRRSSPSGDSRAP